MANVFELSKRAYDLLDVFEEDEGEITPESEKALQELMADIDDKAEAYYYMIRAAENRVRECRLHAQIFADQARRNERLAKRVKGNWKKLLILKGETGENPVSTGTWGKTSLRTTKALELTDPDLVPTEYWKETVTRKIDKTVVKQALKNGIAVEGAELVEVVSIAIRSR